MWRLRIRPRLGIRPLEKHPMLLPTVFSPAPASAFLILLGGTPPLHSPASYIFTFLGMMEKQVRDKSWRTLNARYEKHTLFCRSMRLLPWLLNEFLTRPPRPRPSMLRPGQTHSHTCSSSVHAHTLHVALSVTPLPRLLLPQQYQSLSSLTPTPLKLGTASPLYWPHEFLLTGEVYLFGSQHP